MKKSILGFFISSFVTFSVLATVMMILRISFFLDQPLKVSEPTFLNITKGMLLKVLLFQLERNDWINPFWITYFIHYVKPSLKKGRDS